MDNGELYVVGESSNGEMGIGTEQGDRNGTFRVHGLEDVKIIKVHCDQWSDNTNHTIALDDKGTVWC